MKTTRQQPVLLTLRIFIIIMNCLLVLQYMLGMILNLFSNIPFDAIDIKSNVFVEKTGIALGYARTSSILTLQLHWLNASLLILLSITLIILGVKSHKKMVWILSIILCLIFSVATVSIIGVLLGGNQQLLLIRESFVTGVIGLAFLISLILPKSLGYYFAKQFLTANDPTKSEHFAKLWQHPHFQGVIREGTIFWGLLLVGEFVLRVVMVLTLPIPLVLAVSPIAFNAFIFGGIAVSAVWAKSAIQHITT